MLLMRERAGPVIPTSMLPSKNVPDIKNQMNYSRLSKFKVKIVVIISSSFINEYFTQNISIFSRELGRGHEYLRP